MKKFLSLALGVFLSVSAFARDFTYNDVVYTVLDEGKKTVETKAGYYDSAAENNFIPGNTVGYSLELPEKVSDGSTEYTLVSIGDYGFCSNSSLMSVKLPATIENIGDFAFTLSYFLFDINIPENVSSIGTFAFAGCILLSSVDLPEGIEFIQTATFSICSSLKSIKIPNSVTRIETYAFQKSGLESIVIPENVSYIGKGAFSETKLTTVTLPSKVSTIGAEAFAECGDLKEIYYDTKNLAYINSDSFAVPTYMYATLYVPKGMKSVVAQTANWKNFINVEEIDFAGVDEVINDVSDQIEYYDLNGARIGNPQPGQIVIKRTGNKTEKIIF